MSQVADAIEARADDLAAAALAAMYADPFWDERFGERGRRFAAEDNRHHATYLVQALRAGSPDLLVGYARWLQPVLTTRGMCSRHLAQNVRRLADAVGAAELDAAGSAREYLGAAEAALLYPSGPARAVQLAADAVAADAATGLYGRHPDWAGRSGEDGRARCVEDLLDLLSYLADGLANGRPDLFVAHARWADGFLARRGGSPSDVAEMLAALDDALGRVGGDDHETARALLRAARAALANPEA